MPRSLLKNGKRSADYLESSRQSELTSSQAFSTTASSPPPTPPPPAILPNDSVRLSAIMKDINLLRDDINDLKREVAHLNCQAQPSPHIDTCHIKVYFPSPCTPVLDPTAVSNLLGCPSLLVTRISPKSIKVKILKSCLYNALQSSDSTSHLVYIWKNCVNRPPSNTTMPPPSHSSSGSIKITTWNCRGLLNSIPYIQHLISTGTDILVLQEHWLWPYELSELQSINPNYTYTAVSDSRLTPTSTLTRGCGGCAIIWKKTIPAVVMSNLESDRSCGIKVPIKDTHTLTILGVYVPSSDQPQEFYNKHLATINQVISSTPCSSPLLVFGDLNCHLGHLGGPRSSDEPNHRGMQWKYLLDNHSLYVPSPKLRLAPPTHTPLVHFQPPSTTSSVTLRHLQSLVHAVLRKNTPSTLQIIFPSPLN